MKPIRRSQAITPFGPGAMVDFPGPVTLIHAAIDAWPFDESNREHDEFRIDDEPRLAHRLGVEFFVLPPDFRRLQKGSGQSKNLNLKLPFLRFPRWHVCPIPSCGRMHFGEYHDRDAPVCTGRGPHAHKPRKTFQVRFVAACQKGHLTDFPWVEWVFEGNAGGWRSDGVARWLTLKSSGSASLMGMQVSAEELLGETVRLVKNRTLSGAFGGGASEGADSQEFPLSRIDVLCKGENPVLAIGTGQRPAPGCGANLQAILKNATNIYFSNVVSSIYIPSIEDSSLSPDMLELLDEPSMKRALRDSALDADDGLVSVRSARRLLAKYYPESDITAEELATAANEHLLAGVLLEHPKRLTALEQLWKMNGGDLSLEDISDVVGRMGWDIDPVQILSEVNAGLSATLGQSTTDSEQAAAKPPADMVEEEVYRRQEYEVFIRDIQAGFPKKDLDIRSKPIKEYAELATSGFKRVSLLHKLRETRAFDGFSRINSSGLKRHESRALFAEREVKWLPAIIVRGEGIFIDFDHDQIAAWEAAHKDALDLRLKPLRQSLAALAVQRNQPLMPLTAGYLLLHTFAHVLITELVQECGYGSASLRERIYWGGGAEPMSGVLIYTAAGDSEGTMGGLVRMGEPDRLVSIVINAINKARWCSSDPVCIESAGQGPGNCNLAGCHSCALLPETSCEEQNRKLDRAMLVGTLENPELGFFASLLD